jgi:hypothetical protein
MIKCGDEEFMPFCVPSFLKQMHLKIRTNSIGLIPFVDIRMTRLNETTVSDSSLQSSTFEMNHVHYQEANSIGFDYFRN